MAEKKEAKGGLDQFLEILKEHWVLFAVIIVGYLAFSYNSVALLLYKIFLGIMPVVGVVILGRIAWKMWVHYI
ncbi:hypothetical protein HYW73_02760, partial [Candidatus Nomurabacteria bacterium]|nr:hypothetical protein [Candidatus Nomurabacteria bacterium]